MEQSGVYSTVLGLVSLGLSIYFIEDLIIRIGLIILITVILIFFYFRDYISQINNNTKKIEEFEKKLNLHDRLNRIENQIKILRGGEK